MSPRQSTCDVLVVGAGPAGLMLALQLGQMGVNVKIIDKMPHPVLRGHADGLHSRTNEVLDAMGLYESIRAQGYEWQDGALWGVKDGKMELADRVCFDMSPFSRMRAVITGQERIEATFIAEMGKYGVGVDRLLAPRSMEVGEGEYPVTVELQDVAPPEDWDEKDGTHRSNVVNDSYSARIEEGHTCEIVKCKYLVGCDGAHSWVRKQLGLVPQGDGTNSVFGALDCVVDSDVTTLGGLNVFERDGQSVLFIPRAYGLARIYVPIGSKKPGERFDRGTVTVEKIIEAVRDWVRPLKFEAPYVNWWTCYEVGQRCTESMEGYDGRVLIAGDACHTHSPKGGQGMNISMMDSFNLAWKLAGVLNGTLIEDVVRTYSSERLPVAQKLIDFDRRWSALFTGGKSEASPQVMKDMWMESLAWMSGTSITYPPSLVVASEAEDQRKLANNVTVGKVFENSWVLNVFNSIGINLQKRLTPDGRWKIILFPGDVGKGDMLSLLKEYSSFLGKVIERYTPSGDTDRIVEVLSVVKTPYQSVQDMGNRFTSIAKCYTATDTLYSDDSGKAYEAYGVDRAAILLRPDQHVAGVFSMDEEGVDMMDRFLERTFLVRK